MSDFKAIGGTVRARAATELRDRILTGRLRAGTRLDLDEVAAEFGTSRTPVREALLELSDEGLVAITPRSGITVLGITPQDAVDNFAVLAALSGKAAEWATARITPAQLDEMRCAGRRHQDGGRRRRRQLALSPRPEPGGRIAPPADVSCASGRPRSVPHHATSSCSPSRGTAKPQRARRDCSIAMRRRGRRSRRSIAELRRTSRGSPATALGDWLQASRLASRPRRRRPDSASSSSSTRPPRRLSPTSSPSRRPLTTSPSPSCALRHGGRQASATRSEPT